MRGALRFYPFKAPPVELDAVTRTAGLGTRKVGVNLGDIFTIVARKPVA